MKDTATDVYSFIGDARTNVSIGGDARTVRTIAEERHPNVELLGMGTQHIVVGDPVHPDRVIAFESIPNHNRQLFHLVEKYHMHNIMNILYPENFPRLHGVSREDAYNVRERVEDPTPIKFGQYSIAKQLQNEIYSETGIDPMFDIQGDNFVKTADGNYKYIDLLDNVAVFFSYSEEKVAELFRTKRAGGKTNEELKAMADAGDKSAERLYKMSRSLRHSLHRTEELALLQKAFRNGEFDPEEWQFKAAIRNFPQYRKDRLMRDVISYNKINGRNKN
jgi:hypothetical protein